MNNEAEKIFNHIYHSRAWSTSYATDDNQQKITLDGPGSTLWYTVTIRSELPKLLKKWNIKSLLDASCGEFSWMRELDLTGIEYTGGDIVKDKIDKLSSEFPDKKWLHLDIIEDDLPEVELWMCRDTIFHFPHDSVWKTLENFARSKIKYLLISSHPNQDNQDIDFGGFHPINFDASPFSFSEPLDKINDTGPDYPVYREMYLYSREQIESFLVRRT